MISNPGFFHPVAHQPTEVDICIQTKVLERNEGPVIAYKPCLDVIDAHYFWFLLSCLQMQEDWEAAALQRPLIALYCGKGILSLGIVSCWGCSVTFLGQHRCPVAQMLILHQNSCLLLTAQAVISLPLNH